jgi:photosystem II stability/assembly factor-like uncharacterized protein
MKIVFACFVALLLGCARQALPVERTSIIHSRFTACTQLDGGAFVSGTWEQLPIPSGTNAKAFVVNPSDQAEVWLGTDHGGILHTTDCGNTWVKVNTGILGSQLDKGRQITMALDSSGALYTCAKDGPGGLWKSSNGGVDWTQILPTSVTMLSGNAIELITTDPTDGTHLLVSFHEASCTGFVTGCLAETHDSGATWLLTNSAEKWVEGDGQAMRSSTEWYFGNPLSGGIWRTIDAGVTWTKVFTGIASNSFYFSPATGSVYVASASGVRVSADGITWTTMNGPHGSKSTSVIGDGTSLFASYSPCYNSSTPPGGFYRVATESLLADGGLQQWQPLASPVTGQGGRLDYDIDHDILYSSNCGGGFWRAVVGP